MRRHLLGLTTELWLFSALELWIWNCSASVNNML